MTTPTEPPLETATTATTTTPEMPVTMPTRTTASPTTATTTTTSFDTPTTPLIKPTDTTTTTTTTTLTTFATPTVSVDMTTMTPSTTPVTPNPPSSWTTMKPITPTQKESQRVRIETRTFLKIPIDLDGWKDVEILGLKKGAPRWEEWLLKINGKFIGVRGNRVVLTNKPTVLNVKFFGKDQRIVRILLPGHGFLTVPTNSPCLITKKEPMDDGQFFVINKHGPNIATIHTTVHMRKVPKDWSVPQNKEIIGLEFFEELFQWEMVPLANEDLDEEEKVR